MTRLSPPNPTKRLLERPDAALLYGKVPLMAIVDPDISDRQIRIMGLLGAHDWKGRPVHLFHNDIANAVNCSRRQAIREVTAKAIKRYVAVRKSNSGNTYVLISPVFEAETPKATSPRKTSGKDRCQTCGRQVVLDKMGVCIVCRKQETADKEVAAFLRDKGACPLEIVYLGLKANGSKCGSVAIRKAYIKATVVRKPTGHG